MLGTIDSSSLVLCWRRYWLRLILVALVTAVATANLIVVLVQMIHSTDSLVVSENVDPTLVALSEVAFLSMTLEVAYRGCHHLG